MTIRPQIASAPGGIFFLGDWPNDEAEIKGRPFVGADGHLLSRALRAANLTDPSQPDEGYEPNLFPEARRLLWERRAHSFAYVLGEQPDRSVRAMLGQAGPKKFADWAEANVSRAATEFLDRSEPNVVVPIGPLALWYLTGKTSVDDWRGAPQESLCGLKVLPTYPPDRVMQQYKLFGPLIADLMKVKHEARFPEVRPVEIALWLEPALVDLQEFERLHIVGADYLTIDIETAVGQIVCVQIGTDARTALVLPFVDYRKGSRSYWDSEADERRAWAWLASVLANDKPKILQNGQYDCTWLLDKAGLIVRNYRHDLRLMHHILQPELPKSLAFMGSLYTQLPRWKSGVRHSGTAEKRDA